MASKEEVEKRKRKRNKEKKEKKDKKKRKTITSTMSAAEEEEKRKRKRKRKKEKKEKGKRKRKRERKRTYSSLSDSSDSSDSVECAHCSRENKKYGKKRKPSDVGDQPIILLTDVEMGVKGLKAWNKKQLKSGGSEYEFVRILRTDSCVRMLKGWIFHINFEAKPMSSSDEQIQLFFAELKRNACDTEPHVTLCCPVQMIAPLGSGTGSGSTKEPCGGSGDAPVAGSGGGAIGGLAASEGGLGDVSGGRSCGGSNDAFACHSGDQSSSSEDDSSEDDSSADDEVLNCRFCPPQLIHPARGYDVGLWRHRIPVRNPPFLIA